MGLIEIGLLNESIEKVIEEELYKDFFMHKTGHWLGLDVHDVGEYENIKFKPGMIITVEPGIYISSLNKKIPKEWRLVEGYIKYKNKIILNAKKNNLSVINYSTSVDKMIDLKELKRKIYTHPKLKKATTYVTSYYKDNWRFCMTKSIKNAGTQILKQLRKQAHIEWKKKYGDDLKWLITFVAGGNNGAVYKADNWKQIGETAGLPKHKAVSMKWHKDNLDTMFVKPTGENKKIIFIKKLDLYTKNV